jgi:type VI secretion system protein ImpI
MFVLRIVKGREHAAGAAAELRLPPAPAKVAIGRDPHVTWPLPDRTLALSARHCEIIVGGHGAVLRDLSTNGTFVNGAAGRMTQDHALAAGDEFDLGPYRIIVEPMTTLPEAESGADALITLGGASLPDPPPVVIPLARGTDPAAALGAAPRRFPPPNAPAPPWPPAADDDSPVTRIRPPPRPQPVADAPAAPIAHAPALMAPAPAALAP